MRLDDPLHDFGHLRSMLNRAPSEERFHQILVLLWDAPEAQRSQWMHYAAQVLEHRWPDWARTVYVHWWVQELRHADDAPQARARELLGRHHEPLEGVWQLGVNLNTGLTPIRDTLPLLQSIGHSFQGCASHSADLDSITLSALLDELPNLKMLNLYPPGHMRHGPRSILEVMGARFEEGPRVTSFGLHHHAITRWNTLSAPQLRAFFDQSQATGLESLHLCGLGLDAHALGALLEREAWAALRLLDLSGNAIQDKDLTALLTSPLAGTLETLILMDNPLSALARAQLSARFRHSLVM